jgi:hypothetical protein
MSISVDDRHKRRLAQDATTIAGCRVIALDDDHFFADRCVVRQRWHNLRRDNWRHGRHRNLRRDNWRHGRRRNLRRDNWRRDNWRRDNWRRDNWRRWRHRNLRPRRCFTQNQVRRNNQ